MFAIGQAIYQNKYSQGVHAISNLPNADAIVNNGITAFIELAPPEFKSQIESIAVDSVKYAYYTPIALLGLMILVAFPFAEWVSVCKVGCLEIADFKYAAAFYQACSQGCGRQGEDCG